jgi:hypothetical protein
LNSSLSFGIPPKDTHLFQIFAAVLCDLLWFHENKAAHDGVIPDILVFVSSITKLSLDHFAAWRSISSPVSSYVSKKWTHPPENFYKINFDTAIRESFSTQAAICRNSHRRIVKALSQISPLCDPVYGEALAARLAASLAVSLNLRDFCLESDSITVILALQDPSQILDWKIADLITDSVLIISSSSIWKAQKIHRSANFCAHHMAYWAAANAHSGCIPTYFFSIPSFPICSGKDPPSSL